MAEIDRIDRAELERRLEEARAAERQAFANLAFIQGQVRQLLALLELLEGSPRSEPQEA